MGVGLESSNDTILRDCWNKGTTFQDYVKSVKILQSLGSSVKTYVFIKPPFLNEREALIDAIKTIIDAKEIGTNVISMVTGCLPDFLTLIFREYSIHSFD